MSVTVAIPLHLSAPWVDNIVANVTALPADVTEVLLSDRTCLDDAADQLRSRFANDPRVVVVAEPRDLTWTEHCQLLIEEARGDLVTLLPHDDVFDPSWVPILREALEAHPEALLAYGRLEKVEPDGVTPAAGWTPPALPPPGEVTTGWQALEAYLDGLLWVPFRGLVRRKELLDSGIRLRSPDAFPGNCSWILVDSLWVFSMALHSGLVHDDRTVTWKRIHPGSATAMSRRGRPGGRHRPGAAVLRRYGPGGLAGVAMTAHLWVDWARRGVRYLAQAWQERRRSPVGFRGPGRRP